MPPGQMWRSGSCGQDPGLDGRTAITLFEGRDGAQKHAGTSHDARATVASSSPAYAIVDLTAAYGLQNSSRVERGFAFTASFEHLLIVDEFEFPAGSAVQNVSWTMHTMAAITLLAPAGGGAGSAAVLSLGGATLHATLIEPKGGTVFSASSVDLLPPYVS